MLKRTWPPHVVADVLQTALGVFAFLGDVNSSRTEEFRSACDGKFAQSTVFKTSEEVVALRKQAIAPPPEDPKLVNGDDKAEVIS